MNLMCSAWLSSDSQSLQFRVSSRCMWHDGYQDWFSRGTKKNKNATNHMESIKTDGTKKTFRVQKLKWWLQSPTLSRVRCICESHWVARKVLHLIFLIIMSWSNTSRGNKAAEKQHPVNLFLHFNFRKLNLHFVGTFKKAEGIFLTFSSLKHFPSIHKLSLCSINEKFRWNFHFIFSRASSESIDFNLLYSTITFSGNIPEISSSFYLRPSDALDSFSNIGVSFG